MTDPDEMLVMATVVIDANMIASILERHGAPHATATACANEIMAYLKHTVAEAEEKRKKSLQ